MRARAAFHAAATAAFLPSTVAFFSFVPRNQRLITQPLDSQAIFEKVAEAEVAALHLRCATCSFRALLAAGTSSINIGEGRDVKSLQEWATSRGFQLADGVKLASNRGDDWGMSLHQSAKAGTAVMRVPTTIVLSSEDDFGIDTNSAREIIDELGMDEHWPEFLLMVRITVEKAKGVKSNWFPWLQSLPVAFTTGLFMDEVERSRLPALAMGLVELQDMQLQAFSQALHSLSDVHIRHLLSKPDADDLIRWAFSIVFTRSHRYSTGAGVRTEIVPMGDMFNHHDPGDVVWNDNTDENYVEFVLKEDVDVNRGESKDLYLSYGLANPHRFLAIFGFVDEQIPEVISQVIFTRPTPEMVALGCNDPKKMVLRSDGLIANAVWDTMLYAILASKPDEQKALYDAHVRGDRDAKAAIHSRYALEVSLNLKKHVEQTLSESYPEERTDAYFDRIEHPILPLICRNNALMRDIFSRVKGRLDDIVDYEWRRRIAEQSGGQSIALE